MQDSNYLTLEQNENFPACFPDDFEQNILPHDVEFRAYHAYRILKMGTLDRNAFISSFEEFKDNTYKPRGFNIRSPETFSTSVLSDLQDAKNLLKFMCRHHPQPLIAEGFTEPLQKTYKKLLALDSKLTFTLLSSFIAPAFTVFCYSRLI